MIAELPRIRGRAQERAPLGPTTWFRVGGPADLLARPEDDQDAVALLRQLEPSVPFVAVGAASNLIVRDGGVRGVVAKLPARGFGAVVRDGEDAVIAGAAALDATVAEHAASWGLAGLEFLCGIPGTVGGAVAMNAGAYGREVADVLDWAEIATASGVERLSAAALQLSYREAHLPPRSLVLRARFRAAPGDAAAIAARMAEIRAAREAAQPVRARTGGSTFRNPDGPLKAWQLIERAGCRGLTRGGARVSEKHCNFLLNTGNATAADIEDLGEEVRARVLADSGIDLRWEIKRIGERLA